MRAKISEYGYNFNLQGFFGNLLHKDEYHYVTSESKFGDVLFAIDNFLNRTIGSHRPRKIKLKFHDSDFYDLSQTLSHIIYGALKEFPNHVTGIPAVDNKDVPEELRTEDDYDEKKWRYVLDEMTFAFEALSKEESYDYLAGKFYNPETQKWDMDAEAEHYKRVQNGLRLFGKYYKSLWT